MMKTEKKMTARDIEELFYISLSDIQEAQRRGKITHAEASKALFELTEWMRQEFAVLGDALAADYRATQE